MDHRFHVHQPPYAITTPPAEKKTESKKADTDFERILQDAGRLKISKHAQKRMDERNIAFRETKWDTISEKVDDAREKGVTDSLVLTDDAALLVSTKNNTVITAMGRNEATSKIFTNINGAIVINE